LPDSPKVPREAIDFVLVPGVPFDENGGRLGYVAATPPPAAAQTARRANASAFDLQIVDRVPAAPHDVAVDAVVTETRTFVPRR
jgi:5-formyltetrahydrofolate cyclo-ligase